MPGAELSWEQIEATQNAANKKAGPRFVPGRRIPVPSTVSPSLQTTIAAPYRVPAWDPDPCDAAHWKTLISRLAEETAAATRDIQEKPGVMMEPTVIDGVKAFILTPKVIAPENKNRLLVNVHGGGHIYNREKRGQWSLSRWPHTGASRLSLWITGCLPITRIPLAWTIA